jgi:hypothetical protein
MRRTAGEGGWDEIRTRDDTALQQTKDVGFAAILSLQPGVDPGRSRQSLTPLFVKLPVMIIEFIPMSVTLADIGLPIGGAANRAFNEMAGVRP